MHINGSRQVARQVIQGIADRPDRVKGIPAVVCDNAGTVHALQSSRVKMNVMDFSGGWPKGQETAFGCYVWAAPHCVLASLIAGAWSVTGAGLAMSSLPDQAQTSQDLTRLRP